jgi:probable rRNA maturation factor
LIVRTGERVAGRAELADFAVTLQRRVTGRRTFTCLFTNDAELRGLNRRFRGKNKATDVLSFPTGWRWRREVSGDIAVSLDHARAQARDFGHRMGDELRILMLHGVLHLLGMDHEADSGEMARAEVAWRKELRLPAGLIERVQV